jgi:hypothetical protein
MLGLRILQYNVHKSKDRVLIPLFEDERIADIDIIAVQEPWLKRQRIAGEMDAFV